MIQIEITNSYPVSLREGFAYITDLKNWGNYWPNFVRIKDPANARWSKAGDAVTLVLRLLNREREMAMELEEFKPDVLVAYRSRQTSLPDAHHERHFRAIHNGFEYRLVVAYAPRPGFVGLLDRSLVRRAIKRALLNTHQNLDAIFRQFAPDRNPKFSTRGD